MREDITPEYDVSRIIMDAEANPSKIYVVLEGRGDQIVWENCFNNLVQYRVPDNIISNQKQSVINICQISFSREVFNIIGIVDSDFDRLYTPYNHIVLKNLFYSDHHDIDIMLFMSNALEKYLRVRGSIKLACEYLEIKYENDINWKNIILSLRNLIVEWSYQIGVLKFINIENQYGLQFDNCHLSIEKDKKFRIQNYIKVLCDNSKKSFLMKQIENDFKNFLSLLSNISKLEVANGHDMFEFIGLLIKSVIGRNHGEIAKGIEKDIRLSFECLFFSNTELVKKLKEWEIANNMILF